MSMEINLEGRTFLVCGVQRSGISGATARMIAKAGGTVIGVDYSQEIVDETIADIKQLGGACHGIVANLMEPAETDLIVEKALAFTGRLDGVANIAGGTTANEWLPLEETSLEMFRRTLNLNFEYVFRICRDVAKSMINRDVPGSIVNVGSVSSLAAAPFHGPYGAAKSGIQALTKTMAFEWGKYGIRANTVSPGAVPSGRVMNRGGTAPAPKADANAGAGAGIIFTTMDELASMIVFLLSDLASGVSGQHIAVDSGLSTKFCGGTRPFEVKKRNPVV